MTEVEVFTFPDTRQRVRTLDIAGQPWFVATDVCEVLEMAHTPSAIRGLDDDEKGVRIVHTPGGDQRVSIVNEPGLYALILRSRKPEAKAFKRWVTHEVLPSIRKTGGYATGGMSTAEFLACQAQLMVEQERRTAELEARLDGIEQNTGWYTALGYARREDLPTSHRFLLRLGTAAGKATRAAGEQPAKTRNEAYGTVNSYPEWALDAAVALLLEEIRAVLNGSG